VHGDGLQSRDFTYVDTVCDVLVDAVLRRVSHPEPLNLAYGSRTNLMELVAVMQELLGRELEVEHTDPRVGDMRHTQASNERLVELFPDVRPVDLEDGLRRTIAWFETRPDLLERATAG
jgi:UDP-glucose 4-epimerase